MTAIRPSVWNGFDTPEIDWKLAYTYKICPPCPLQNQVHALGKAPSGAALKRFCAYLHLKQPHSQQAGLHCIVLSPFCAFRCEQLPSVVATDENLLAYAAVVQSTRKLKWQKAAQERNSPVPGRAYFTPRKLAFTEGLPFQYSSLISGTCCFIFKGAVNRKGYCDEMLLKAATSHFGDEAKQRC